LGVELSVGEAVKVFELVTVRVPLGEEVPVFEAVIEDVAVLVINPLIVFLEVFEKDGEDDDVFEDCILLLFVGLPDDVFEIAGD
jgi:hypothetical protein